MFYNDFPMKNGIGFRIDGLHTESSPNPSFMNIYADPKFAKSFMYKVSRNDIFLKYAKYIILKTSAFFPIEIG